MNKNYIIGWGIFVCLLLVFITGLVQCEKSLLRKELELKDAKIIYLETEITNNKEISFNFKSISEQINDFKCPDCNSNCYCYKPETSEFDKLLKENAEDHPYILDEYDCTEFANEGARRLQNLGFIAKEKFVNIDCELWTDDWEYIEYETGYGLDDCKGNNGGHKIIQLDRVYVESTTGEVIMPYDYARYRLN